MNRYVYIYIYRQSYAFKWGRTSAGYFSSRKWECVYTLLLVLYESEKQHAHHGGEQWIVFEIIYYLIFLRWTNSRYFLFKIYISATFHVALM